MKILFILNRASGSYNEVLVKRCVEAVRNVGAEVNILYPESPKEFRTHLRLRLNLVCMDLLYYN